MDEWVPLEQFYKLTKLWWLWVAAALLGALVGYAFHRSQPPLYEATATFFAVIDPTAMQELNLPSDQYQYNEDMALASVEWAVRAPETTSAVIDALAAQNISIDVAALARNSSILRKHAFWELSYRSSDPVLARAIVNVWAEKAYQLTTTWKDIPDLMRFVSYNPPILASLPQTPAIYDRNRVILAGALAGLLIGFGLSSWLAGRQG